MSQIKTYSKLLSYRRISKAIQQISWQLNKVEQKYRLDFDDATEEEMEALIRFYNEIFESLININNELKNANKNNKHKDL